MWEDACVHVCVGGMGVYVRRCVMHVHGYYTDTCTVCSHIQCVCVCVGVCIACVVCVLSAYTVITLSYMHTYTVHT